MIFTLNDQEIDHVSKIQRFAYRCLSMFGPQSEHKYNRARKTELIHHWAQKLFADFEYQVIFDESVWMPDDPTSIENVVRLVSNAKTTEYKIIVIDFRDAAHSIFNTEFKKNG